MPTERGERVINLGDKDKASPEKTVSLTFIPDGLRQVLIVVELAIHPCGYL